MIPELLSEITEAVQLLLLLLVLIYSFRFARKTEDNLYLIFYSMAMGMFLCSDLYWFAHQELRDGLRVPFAPDDIADFGLFLLLGSAVNAAMDLRGKYRRVILWAALFTAANIALWIAWSGEWVRDLFGGLAYGYFLCAATRALWGAKVLRRWEWIGCAALSALLIVIQSLSIALSTPDLRKLMETVGYVILFAVMLWLLIRSVMALAGKNGDQAFSLCFAAFCWITVTLYMSSGAVYTVAANLTTVGLLLMFLSVRKKVTAA